MKKLQLNYEVLNERLSQIDARTKLVKYIFEVQGGELKRLDYGRAGKALGVDWTTVRRYCNQLADEHIIIFQDNGLKLNQDILTAI